MLHPLLLLFVLASPPIQQNGSLLQRDGLSTPVDRAHLACSDKDCAPDSVTNDGATRLQKIVPSKLAPPADPAQQEPPNLLDGGVLDQTDLQPSDGESETEFQMLVESSIGKRIPLFGRRFFSGAPSTFAPVERMPARADYVLGPGDELLLRAWGSIDLDAHVTVDRSGQIVIPKVGVVKVAGLHSDQIEGYLKHKISQQFTNFDLNVTLGKLRAIQIFLLGQVRRPGSYTVGALSTMVNALLASGGPSATGSMRDIQLKRMGVVVAHLDLYDLLLSGDKSRDVLVESGDVIYVPPVGPLAAIVGSVNNSAIFELRGPTTLEKALEYAGGLNSVAGAQRLVVEAVAGRTRRTVNAYSLADGLSQTLHDGDLVRVFPVSPEFENAVTLRGAVAQPGRYPWRPGMHLSELIPTRQSLITREFWNKQNALGFNQPSLFGTKEAVEPTDFKRNPSEINWSYALLSRLAPDLTTRLLPFDLGNAIDHPHTAADLALQPGDVVTVFSQTDLPVSVERQSRYVTVVGEVNAPGVYQVSTDATVRDVVAAAGGVTMHSYLYATDLRRESVRVAQREKMKEMISRLRIELSVRSAATESFSTAEDSVKRQLDLAHAQAYLQEMTEIQPSGRVVLDVSMQATQVSALPPLPLEDKDVIVVPARGGTIDVIGAVNNENALIYEQNESVSDYLAKAGGPTRVADLKQSFIIRADGSVYSLQGHSHFFTSELNSLHLMPGDALVVPNRLHYSNVLRGVREWSQIFSQFALGVAAAKVLNQ